MNKFSLPNLQISTIIFEPGIIIIFDPTIIIILSILLFLPNKKVNGKSRSKFAKNFLPSHISRIVEHYGGFHRYDHDPESLLSARNTRFHPRSRELFSLVTESLDHRGIAQQKPKTIVIRMNWLEVGVGSTPLLFHLTFYTWEKRTRYFRNRDVILVFFVSFSGMNKYDHL